MTPADRSSVGQGRPSGCLGRKLVGCFRHGKRGDGYGSEDHLRRLLDADPSRLTEPLTKKARLDPSQIEWLPFPRNAQGKEREFQGIAFLAPDMRKGLTEAWREFWPQKGRKPSWDAIARAGDTWFLVEAKANHPEFASPGSRSEGEPRKQIERSLCGVELQGRHRVTCGSSKCREARFRRLYPESYARREAAKVERRRARRRSATKA